MEGIKEVIAQVIQKIQPSSENKNQKLLYAWKEVFSKTQLKHCCIVEFKDKCLIMHVDSSNQLYQFNLDKQKLIKKLNKAIGTDIIDNIYFKVGAVKNYF